MGKNQHYVPQFYLRLFSNNSKSIGTWNSETDTMILNASIKNMASRYNLYGSDQELEKELSIWESDWRNTIHKIIETNKIETIDEFASLLTFITIGRSRTLKSADANNYISEYLANITDIKSEYFELFLESLLIYLVIKIIKHLTILIFTKLVQNNKRRFDFKRKINTIAVLFTIICLIFVWESRIWKFMTLISFIAGAITFALRDIVSNFFSIHRLSSIEPHDYRVVFVIQKSLRNKSAGFKVIK